MPNGLHEIKVECLVIISEVNPTSESRYYVLPFLRVSHHNGSALLVILLNAHFSDLVLIFNIKGFINFMLNRKTMAIPTKSPGNIVFSLCSIPAYDILDCAGANVAVVGSAGGKRWPIVEGERWEVLGKFQLFFE